MTKKKQIEDLTNKEILEDLKYYICYANTQSPPFVDKTFNIILKYVNELEKRSEKSETNQKFIDFLEHLHFNLNGVITEKKVSMMIIKKIEELKGGK